MKRRQENGHVVPQGEVVLSVAGNRKTIAANLLRARRVAGFALPDWCHARRSGLKRKEVEQISG